MELLKDVADEKEELEDIQEEEEETYNNCIENDLDIQFNIKQKDNKCYKLPEQKVKII